MCLSTVYWDDINQDNIVMKNVMAIECNNDKYVLVDLMERKMIIKAKLIKANLVDGYVIFAKEGSNNG